MTKTSIHAVIFFLGVGLTHMLYAQKVDLQLKSGNQIRTFMTDVNSIQIFTNDGVFALVLIKSASFWDNFPDSTAILKLRNAGVPVYLKMKRLGPIVKKDTMRYFSAVASLGVGLGLDYGGIGAKLELLPASPIGVFGGVGSNLSGVGYNVGLSCKLHPYKPSTPYLLAMYGYNAVYNGQSYYGFTTGFGSKFRMDRRNKSHFNIAMLIPFRDSFLRDKIKKGIWAFPILISLGFNFNVGSMK